MKQIDHIFYISFIILSAALDLYRISILSVAVSRIWILYVAP